MKFYIPIDKPKNHKYEKGQHAWYANKKSQEM